MKEKTTGLDYFKLVLLAFAGLGLELVLALVESFFYGKRVSFENWTIITHWIFTYALWGVAIFFILRCAIREYGFELRECPVSPKLWQYILVVILILFSCIVSYVNWGGVKPCIELKKLGTVKFIMQYIYYLFETVLFTIIIVFGQKAFEKWLKNDKMPYGGIVCALTWGIIHVFTKSSVEAGTLCALLGFGFGTVYLLLNRNMAKTIPVLFLMFVL